ncbi:unnamed protein product [Orchesella dallaii]|uniref:Prefoldin subunit 6 n=1 Tax=Orchesella dallaii TaxID=48710 RepID=A0ABP1PRC2_9HEXA
MAAKSEEFQKKFQTEAEKYAGLNKKLNKLVTQSQTLETQLNENQMVKDELDITRDDARVFKLVGPVMVPQTVDDAKTNVNRRIDFIKAELKRNSDVVESVTKDVTAQRDILSALEMQARQMAGPGVGPS